MGMIWDDRLAEVWASPNKSGAGVVVGPYSLLTAWHVVRSAGSEGRVLARVVCRGAQEVPWVTMRVVTTAPAWDVALLTVDNMDESQGGWRVPVSASPTLVRLGTAAERDCEAVGFPDALVQQDPDGSPSSRVRQSEQAVGILLAGGQARPPVNPSRPLPAGWVPLDVSTSTPGLQAGWGGMSGAGVLLPAPDGRLVGLVVSAESEHQSRRLYLVPLADVLAAEPELEEAIVAAAGHGAVEVRNAPLYRRLLYSSCLDADGAPVVIRADTDLDRFGDGMIGVKPTSIAGESEYLDYVPRDGDGELQLALAAAVHAGRMLLVVGESAAGKSRSTVEAIRAELVGRRLLHPPPFGLSALLELPPVELSRAVVWLDEAQQYADAALADTLRRLAAVDVAVVGTIRRAELDLLLAAGEIRNPAGAALEDTTLVDQLPWLFEWSTQERSRVSDHVKDVSTRKAVEEGTPLGAWAVAGPQLLAQFERFKHDEAFPCTFRLVETVLGWYRTGIGRAMPRQVLIQQVTAAGCSSDEVQQAMNAATESVIGRGRLARYSLLRLSDVDDLVGVDDYLLNHDQQKDGLYVPDALWTAANRHAISSDERWRVGLAAFERDRLDVTLAVFGLLAAEGDPAALVNKAIILGMLERSQEAIGVYDEVVERFGDDPTPPLREQVAKALVNKAITLGMLERSQEEIGVYDEVVERFGDDPTPPLREITNVALQIRSRAGGG